MAERRESHLKRRRYPMPAFLREALARRDLLDAYTRRPPYQQNDYIGWIMRAKKPETRDKRLHQMLDELETGDRYMNMPYEATRRVTDD